MGSLAARRAGRRAASTPAAEPSTAMTTSGTVGTANVPSSDTVMNSTQPSTATEHEAERGAEGREDHRLESQHRPDLPPGLTDRTQQAELGPSLVDRERERVRDAEQRDDDRQGEHHVDDVEQEVEAAGRRVGVLGQVLDVAAVALGDRLDRAPGLRSGTSPTSC